MNARLSVRRAALLGAIMVAVAGGAVAPRATLQPAPARPYVSWSGPHSLHKPGFYLIQTAEEWRTAWTAHAGDRVERDPRSWAIVPDIDFSRCVVVAYFRGSTRNCTGEVVESIVQREDDQLLRFDSITFQTLAVEGEDHGVPTEPYGMWVLPRVAKPIVIEENVQGRIGQPPRWRERTRLDAPAATGG